MEYGHAPLKRNVTIDEVGNLECISYQIESAVTGEIHYVDSGFEYYRGFKQYIS